MGIEGDCYKHLASVNKWTREQIDTHIADSFVLYKQRSMHSWTLDISILSKEPYGIKLKTTKNRIFEVKKYKKKRKVPKKKRPIKK